MMWRNEPDEVVKGVPHGRNSVCKGLEVKKTNFFKCLFFFGGGSLSVSMLVTFLVLKKSLVSAFMELQRGT